MRHATHKGTEDTTGLFAIRVWRRGQYLSRASIASIASSDGKAKTTRKVDVAWANLPAVAASGFIGMYRYWAQPKYRHD